MTSTRWEVLQPWWNERKADAPVCAGVGEGGLAATLQRLQRSGIQLTVIDTPPFATTEIASIVRAASLVMVPVVPSPHDLRAIGETIELVEAERRPMVFVVNNASTNGRLTIQAVTALSQHGTVAPSVIHSRQDFRSTMIKDARWRGLPEREVRRRNLRALELSRGPVEQRGAVWRGSLTIFRSAQA